MKIKFFILILIYLAITSFAFPWAMDRIFGFVDYEQLKFFLFTENRGLGMDSHTKFWLIKNIIIYPLIATFAFFLIYLIIRKYLFFKFLNLFTSLSLSLLLFIGIYSINETFNITDGINRQYAEGNVHSYYVNNKPLHDDIINYNNLIILYVESLENSFQIKKFLKKTYFHRYMRFFKKEIELKQLPGTGWTIAAMVASHRDSTNDFHGKQS